MSSSSANSPSSFITSPLNVEIRLGKPPIVRVDAVEDAVRWTAEHRDVLRAAVLEHGSLLVRGIGLRDAAQIEAVFSQLGSPMIEREPFAERQRYSEALYSSTRWPAEQPICMHHELSYTLEFPSVMLFACLTGPTEGGATPLADAATVLQSLRRELVDRFERVGWLLIRNYNDQIGIGTSMPEAFGTADRRGVETYCRANAIKFEWQRNGGLRTWQRRSAIVDHPRTGQRCWFNQIAFLNEWTMDPEVREYLVDMCGADGLPFNTRFGDGEAISADVVDEINKAYEASSTREPWQAGDLMLVDNIRTAHGRERFEGPREVLVAMADARTRGRLRPGDRVDS